MPRTSRASSRRSTVKRRDEQPRTPQYPIESVDNALKLLLRFAEQPSIRLTEASEYLEVASSTAHRLLAMLQYRGFVRQDATTKAYYPGPALTSVAFSVLDRRDIRQAARPVLLNLSESLGETVHLATLEGAIVRYLDAVECSHAVRVVSRVGRSLPAHCTSTGKALLAELSPDELRRLYPDERLSALTPVSITSRTVLERELAKIRRAGYATNREESEAGVASVAVAIPTDHPGPRLALNVAAPVGRLPSSAAKTLVDPLRAAADELRRLLG